MRKTGKRPARGEGGGQGSQQPRTSLYAEITDRIIADLERGCVPWVKPWGRAKAALGLPKNAATSQTYTAGTTATGNYTLANLPAVAWRGVIDDAREATVANRYRKTLKIRSSGIFQRTLNLSGGTATVSETTHIYASGKLNITGGNLTTGNLQIDSAASLSLTGGCGGIDSHHNLAERGFFAAVCGGRAMTSRLGAVGLRGIVRVVTTFAVLWSATVSGQILTPPDQDIWTTSVYSYAPSGGGPGGGAADEVLQFRHRRLRHRRWAVQSRDIGRVRQHAGRFRLIEDEELEIRTRLPPEDAGRDEAGNADAFRKMLAQQPAMMEVEITGRHIDRAAADPYLHRRQSPAGARADELLGLQQHWILCARSALCVRTGAVPAGVQGDGRALP